jgi:hypothetical protein
VSSGIYRKWRSLTSIFSRAESRTTKAQLRLISAYKEVFQGNPSGEDQEMVLADLANAASWRKVCPPTVSNDELRYIEGARSLFSRVFAFISLNDGDVRALEEAARYEAAADETYTG